MGGRELEREGFCNVEQQMFPGLEVSSRCRQADGHDSVMCGVCDLLIW